jgi:hypothetical protein
VLLGRLAEFVTAIAQNDVDFFLENLTDDAMCIFPGTDRVYDKQQTVASMQRLADVMAKEHAQLWINHDKAQRDGQKMSPDFYE